MYFPLDAVYINSPVTIDFAKVGGTTPKTIK